MPAQNLTVSIPEHLYQFLLRLAEERGVTAEVLAGQMLGDNARSLGYRAPRRTIPIPGMALGDEPPAHLYDSPTHHGIPRIEAGIPQGSAPLPPPIMAPEKLPLIPRPPLEPSGELLTDDDVHAPEQSAPIVRVDAVVAILESSSDHPIGAVTAPGFAKVPEEIVAPHLPAEVTDPRFGSVRSNVQTRSETVIPDDEIIDGAKPDAPEKDEEEEDDDEMIEDDLKGPVLYLVSEDGSLDRIAKTRFVIGRASTCDFVCGGQGVSREHAVVLRDGDDYYIEDLQTANGTWMVKRKVSRRRAPDGQFEYAAGTERVIRRRISDGAEFFIGNERIKFVIR